MLKFSFGFLVLANAVLYAWNTGYLGAGMSEGREPARMMNQLNVQYILLVDPFAATSQPQPISDQSAVPAVPSFPSIPFANPAAPATIPAVTVAVTAEPASLVQVAADAGDPLLPQCIEIGNFDAADATRFSQQLVPLAMGDRLSRRSVQEAERHIVYIPPLADKAAAERKGAELRRLGITDFYVMSGNQEMRLGISLGTFKTADAARQHLANLVKKGVHSARVGTRSGNNDKIAFQLRLLDPVSREALTRIRRDFPRQEARSCAPA